MIQSQEVFWRKFYGENFGDFGENIVAEDFDFKNLPVGTRLKCDEVIFEITQIGKKCHSHCEIFHQVGDYIMSREGIFARVLHGGEIKIGDELERVYTR